jgi:hypothetical protein
MIDWLGEFFAEVINNVPLLVFEEGSASFFVVRSMLGLFVIAGLVVFAAYLPVLVRAAGTWLQRRR